jgi:hypothetical protein
MKQHKKRFWPTPFPQNKSFELEREKKRNLESELMGRRIIVIVNDFVQMASNLLL